MKIHILTDLEGVSGVNGRSDGIGNKIINNDAACRLLTEEVNAVVEGLVDAGADEIDVVDGHGGSNSVLIEGLHPAADLINAGGGLYPPFIDSRYDATLQVGMHAMMGTPDASMHHTYNSHGTSNLWLNGEPIGEIGFAGLISAYFGVPTLLVSGDVAACREAKGFFGNVETVETKSSSNRYTVQNYNPVRVRKALRAGAKKALLAKDTFPIKQLDSSYEMKLQLMCPNMADAHEMKGAERVDHSTVLFRSDDLIDLFAQKNGWAAGVYKKKFKFQKRG